MPTSKVIQKHDKTCRANEWSGIVEDKFYGNAFANRHAKIGAYHLWYVVACNDPNCSGKKAVHSSVLANA